MLYNPMFLPRKTTEHIGKYIVYLKARGFSKILKRTVPGKSTSIYVYWRELGNILNIFTDFQWSFDDGSGDDHLSLNGGYISFFTKNTPYWVGMSQSHTKDYTLMHFDSRDNFDRIWRMFKDINLPIPKPFNDCVFLNLWHHDVVPDRNKVYLDLLNRFHNETWELLPERFQKIIPKAKIIEK